MQNPSRSTLPKTECVSHGAGVGEKLGHTRTNDMDMRQTNLSLWCRPYQLQPGRDGAGPLASRGPTQSTGASVDLKAGGRQSRMTGQTNSTPQPQTGMKMAQWNAEGLRCKKTELQAFLYKNCVDIICIQETHLKEAHRFFVRGYQEFRHDRTDRHKGGIITLVRNCIPAVELTKSDGNDLEHQTIKLILPSGDIHITNCYSPPGTPLELHNIKVKPSQHLIMGDFNSHSPSWGYEEMDSRGETVEDWMLDNSLILVNQPEDDPTCYSRAWKTSSTPDLAMATDDVHGLVSREVVNQLGGSDHRPIILTIHSVSTPSHGMEPSWNYKKANWTLFQVTADSLCNNIIREGNLNQKVKEFSEAILQAAETAIPRGKRRHYKPYWSSTLEQQQKELDSARESMEKNPTAEHIIRHNEIKETFNLLKRTEIQKSWREKTKSLNLERDSNKLWNLIRVLNEDVSTKHSKIVIEEEGAHHTDKKAANLLADLYHQESKKAISRPRIREIERQIKRKLQEQHPVDSMISDFSLTELEAAIRKLKAKKAPGKDGITNDMIKKLGHSAKDVFLSIINQSWNTGKLPDPWREAITIPILKKGKNKKDKSSYRPISLLTCLGKVMERMVNARLLNHLEENHHLCNFQSAYRKNRSTEDQLVYLSQKIENAFQERKKTVAIFVDLTKAFDKVCKEGLLLKLLHKEVGGKMFKWIENFLQYRKMRVKVEGKVSHQVTLQEGVPQGGVISPTLFLIFIDDIADKLNLNIDRALHADDFAIWTSADNLCTASLRAQEALNHLEEWANMWGVEINTSKTVSTVFSLSTLPEKVSLTLNGKDLKQESNPTYLGIRLDKRLTWAQHIKDIEVKATRKMSIAKKLAGTTWGANSNILKRVYTGTIRPTLEYGSSAWATASKTNTNRLDRVQNAGLRIITGGLKTTPIQSMEKHTGLHSLDERREEKVLKHREKLLRMPDHPMNFEINSLSKNRLKRTSFKHLQKHLHDQEKDCLPTAEEEIEILTASAESDADTSKISISTEVSGLDKKDQQSQIMQRFLSLEMIDSKYNRLEWAHVYTDGSAEGAVKNGGAGIFIQHIDGSRTEHSFPTGKASSNYRAESQALLYAIDTMTGSPNPPPKVAFFTDCRSVLQALQNHRGDQQSRKIELALSKLATKTTIALQWIPSHCGIVGNERADSLSKAASQMDQPSHPVTYHEAKTIISSIYRAKWAEKRAVHGAKDSIHLMDRKHQTMLFRLRTGHCRLMSHLYRVKIAHTDECPCGTGIQDPEHILQYCPTFKTQRDQIWPQGENLQTKLWGNFSSLERTAAFMDTADIKV